MNVYEVQYEAYGEPWFDLVRGDDLYTALSKWRNKIREDQLDDELAVSGEPDSITRLDNAEIVP